MNELDDYPWRGHRMIIAKAENPWMDRAHVLGQFAGTKRKAILEYRRFVQEGLGDGRNPMLTGGGLIRSQGGWSQVLALRRKGEKEQSDERILGSEDFVDRVLQEAEERQLRQMKLQRRGKGIEDIIQEECRKRKVSEEELRKGSRRSRVSEARAAIAHRSKEELVISGAEIARYLGVNTSSITRTLARMDGLNEK
jgi:hypothetical protein